LELSPPITDLSGELIDYGFFRLKNGIKETTTTPEIMNLKKLSKQANLHEPEAVKAVIATAKWKSSYKQLICIHYDNYLKFKNINWQMPSYTPEESIPFIPLETEIDQLIASCGNKLATLLQILKDTGARIGEALALKWTNIDFERKIVTINNPEKNSNGRIIPLTDKTLSLLNNLTRTKETIFAQDKHSLSERYRLHRITIAKKLNNPRIKQISFKIFRHYKGTMEYHKTKDILHVKYILGHKDIKSTMVYINLEQALFTMDTDEWTTIVIHSIEEETKVINANFQLVRAINETTAIYKKRK
jgi:integrase